MRNFEIQRAILISVSSYNQKGAPKEELWQVVGNGYGDEQYARKRLEAFQKWNREYEFTYRLVWLDS